LLPFALPETTPTLILLTFFQIDHHVTICAFPETAAVWLDLGRRAGFSKARERFVDPTGFYRVFRYDR